jgi:RsiW-degrading membrane proteinase PrsW (M82 family)
MTFDYRIILYIIFGVLPSLVWLIYYLKKDKNPERFSMILKIFLWGIVVALPVFLVQIGMKEILEKFTTANTLIYNLIYWFLIISFSEEFFKYLVVRTKIKNSPEMDEPVDMMIYMVVAALGLAALENVLYLFMPSGKMAFNDLVNRTMLVSFVRFVGATFLHTLCSAVVGYFLAISFCDQKKEFLEVGFGIFIAVLLHGLYDFSIMTLEGPAKVIVPVVILISLAIFVFAGFDKLKKLKSVTKLNIN